MSRTANRAKNGALRALAVLASCVLALAVFLPSRALAAGEGLTVGQTWTTTGYVPESATGEFGYELASVDGAPLPGGVEGVYEFSLAGDASVIWPVAFGSAATEGAITYVHAGIYEYDLTCVGADWADTRTTADTTQYHITVSIVNDDTAPERLRLDKIVVMNAETKDKPESITYAHSYAGDETVFTFSVPVEKVIKGDNPATASVFEFTLESIGEDVPMPDGSADGKKSVKITGEGKADFGEITIAEVGAYVYQVSEVKGSAEGYTYDDGAYRLTVKVTRGEKDVLEGEVVCTDADGNDVSGIVFTNTYEAKTPGGKVMPKTGDPTWGLMQLTGALVVAGVIVLGAGVYGKVRARRRHDA